MQLGRVKGTVIAAVVYEGLEGVPLLFVQPLDRDAQPKGTLVVAADPTRMAGPGELVAYEASREAALALDPWFVPVDHAVISIVDEVSREGWERQ